jgi:hypothetical protein
MVNDPIREQRIQEATKENSIIINKYLYIIFNLDNRMNK